MKKSISFLGAIIFCVMISMAQNTDVQVKVFLQGPYMGAGLMHTTLIDGVLLPLSQPYNESPWEYLGTEHVVAMPANIVDWVLVELRIGKTIVAGRRAGLLRSDGLIIDPDMLAGTAIRFNNLLPGSYYIVVHHRNHMPVMSAQSIDIPNGILYDFSDTLAFPPFGPQALIELEVGVFGMISGDVNKDGKLQFSGFGNDRSLILQRIVTQTFNTNITGTITGYWDEDIRLDSIVKYSGPGNDPSLIIQSLVNITGSTSITSVYFNPVPDGVVLYDCEDTLIDPRDGRKYPAVLIGTQCWMAKNLDIGTILTAGYDQTNNGLIEKYCYSNSANYCIKYGGLYQWDEMMDYSSIEGVQGICPDGWHIPSSDDWNILKGTADSQFGIVDPIWDIIGCEGFDAGLNLKSDNGWWAAGNGTDLFGFKGDHGGSRYFLTKLFYDKEKQGNYWTSTGMGSNAYSNAFYYADDKVCKGSRNKGNGFSVRCIKDCPVPPTQSDAGIGHDSLVTNYVILDANIPTQGVGHWMIASGGGGFLVDPDDPATVFFGMPDSTYILYWIIQNPCGISKDDLYIHFMPNAQFSCGNPFLDLRDNMFYNTLIAGSQCWMKENLNIGDMIMSSVPQSDNALIEKYCHGNDEVSCNEFGALYQWNEMMAYSIASPQGICPTGWHIPSDDEWKTLEGFVDSQFNVGDPVWDGTGDRGYDVGGSLKETYYIHWQTPNTGANNFSGFTALGAGQTLTDGAFSDLSFRAYFWTSTIDAGADAWAHGLKHDTKTSWRDSDDMGHGRSVRCIMD